MKSLLLDEYPLLVLPELAVKIGLNEAIILQQIHYWVTQNKAKNNNFKDGYHWVYNTYDQWHENFPFWSVITIKRIFKKLETNQLIITGNFNKLKIDQTKWYRINYKKLDEICGFPLYQNDTMVVSSCYSGRINLIPPLPETTTETTTEIKREINLPKNDNPSENKVNQSLSPIKTNQSEILPENKDLPSDTKNGPHINNLFEKDEKNALSGRENDIRILLNELNNIFNQSYKLDAKLSGRLANLLEEFSESEIIKAARGFFYSRETKWLKNKSIYVFTASSNKIREWIKLGRELPKTFEPKDLKENLQLNLITDEVFDCLQFLRYTKHYKLPGTKTEKYFYHATSIDSEMKQKIIEEFQKQDILIEIELTA